MLSANQRVPTPTPPIAHRPKRAGLAGFWCKKLLSVLGKFYKVLAQLFYAYSGFGSISPGRFFLGFIVIAERFFCFL
jgi:hypothetical protein